MKKLLGIVLLGGYALIVGVSGVQAQRSPVLTPGESLLRHDAQVEILFSTKSAPLRLNVEVADETPEQDRGLMGRRLAGDNEGMFFVYTTAKPRIFWMRGTPMPLDMLFFDSDRRLVALVSNAEPFSDRLIKSGVPAKYVLELPAGFADRHSVGLGAQFQIVEGSSAGNDR